MKFKYISDDGEVELVNVVLGEADSDSSDLRKPHEGSTCSFRIKSIEISIGHTQTIGGIPLASSTYCTCESAANPEEISKCVTIGITSVSELDRLLDICLTRLHLGEIGEFSIKCARSGTICLVSIELLSIEESPELYDLAAPKTQEIANVLKKSGGVLFSNGYPIDAFYKFSQGARYLLLIHPSKRDEEHVKLLSTLHSNMATCHIKMRNWEDAIELCNMVLEQDPRNVKALYRRGSSYIEVQEYEKASSDLLQAKAEDPENVAIKQKLVLLEDKKKSLNAKYSQAMKKFLS